jgi:glyoxylase-like metal-dependent hydrolase (beta-lactamase superfamily II)
MGARINKISDELYLIMLQPPISGFNDFIGSWLYKGEITYLVDVGPAVTSGSLVQALNELGVHHLDYIFITHIHIDHAGGIGDFINHFPETKVVCHKSGISHLADPERLWEGSVKTLGDIAVAYEKMKPVNPDRLVDAEQFWSDHITPIITPGHSPHHVSYLTEKYLFAGETGGVLFSFPSGDYLRPATPPKFYLDIAVESLNSLIHVEPDLICYGHFGIKDNAVQLLKRHREQLFFWEKVMEEEIKNYNKENFMENCIKRLLTEDINMAGFEMLNKNMQNRELDFIKNSVKGFAGHIQRK